MIDIIKYNAITIVAGNNVSRKVENQLEEHIALIAVISISVASINPPIAA